MTTALALLYGYFGQGAGRLLPVRLTAIAVGAVLAGTTAWWVLPVRGPRSVLSAPGSAQPPSLL